MKKSTIRAVALTLVLTLIAALSASFVKVSAATTYVDTSAYESLAEVYKDYFKVGAACEAISHWNQSNKEIGNPHKEAVLSRIFNSITSGNELKPAYNFDKTSESLFKINRAGNEMLTWAKENAESSKIANDKIRWIVDDCKKFVEREIRRDNVYDGIIMDPPSYGRGPGGEVWKLEDAIYDFVELTMKLLAKKNSFLI